MIRQFYPRHYMLFILAVFALFWLNTWVHLYAKPAPVNIQTASWPVQEWIYITVQGPYWNDGQLYIAIMTRDGAVSYRDDLDLATVTYDFARYTGDRGGFNILKEFFGIDTIRPDQIAELFGVDCVVSYAYLYNLGPKVIHTAQEIFSEFSAGRVKQNRVTIRITE